jgi:hypothetical protein
MAVVFLRIILYFGLLLLVMGFLALALVPRDAPGFIAAVLTVLANLITVSGATILLRILLAKEARREQAARADRLAARAVGDAIPRHAEESGDIQADS